MKLFYNTISTLFFILLFSATALADPPENEELRSFITSRMTTLEVLEQEEQALVDSGAEMLQDVRSQMSGYRQLYQQIILAQGVAGSSPFIIKEIHAGLLTLEADLERTRQSLLYLQNQLETRTEKLNISEAEIDYGAIESLPDGLKRLYENYLTRLRRLKRPLRTQSSKVERELKTVTRLVERTEAQSERLGNSLPSLWKEFFLSRKSPIFSKQFWTDAAAFNDWLALRLPVWKDRLSLIQERSGPLLVTFAGFFTALFGIFMFLVHKQFSHLENPADRRKMLTSCIVACSGITLYAAEYRVIPESLGLLTIAGAGLFAYGSARAGHLYNHLVTGKTCWSQLPALFLFFAGGLLLISSLPEPQVILIWSTLALFLLLMMRRRISKARTISDSPNEASEEKAGTFTIQWLWAPALFIPVALFGYGLLAAFAGMLFSLCYYSVTLGSVMVRFITQKSAQFPDEGLYPFAKALIIGLSSPFIWTASFGLSLFFLYDFIGWGLLQTAVAMEISWQGFTLRILSVFSIIALIFLTRAAVSISSASIERIGSRWPRSQRGTVPSLQTISAYALWALFFVLALNILGVNLTSLTVIAGGLSVGIGFGLQNIINNFISGLILLFGRSLRPGDVIQIGEMWCTVKKVNIRTTTVETFENATIMIPNSNLVTNQMTNWTKNNPSLRRDVAVGVAYGSDTELVRKTLLRVAADHRHIQKYPEPWVLFSNFGASSLDFILRVWVEDIEYALTTVSDLRFAIDRAFREEGIEISFPQLDLHIRSAKGLADTQTITPPLQSMDDTEQK